MGVLNLSPDSFYDGHLNQVSVDQLESSIKDRIHQMIDEEVDIIDIGAESTRPDSHRLDPNEEWDRIKFALTYIKQHTDALLSVDTYKSEIAQKAIQNGADIINDVSGFEWDPGLLDVLQKNPVPYILTHSQGRHEHKKPVPGSSIVESLTQWFQEKISQLNDRGIHHIILDPGIGFGKSQEQNLALMRHIPEWKALGYPILIGVSQKSVIGNVIQKPVDQRKYGSLSAEAISVFLGAKIIRSHFVADLKDVIRVAEAIRE